VNSDRPSIPTALLGGFVDDYGIRYAVSEKEWIQGGASRYEIVEWNVSGRFVIAKNDANNRTDPGLWTRIDWLLLESGGEFGWAFCYAVFDAETEAKARSSADSSRETPRTGCNGFPFSRMRPT